MKSDLIGRRLAVEQRLDRARALELALQEKMKLLALSTGMAVEQFDSDSSFGSALTAIAALAYRRSTFDVIVSLPDAAFGVRIQRTDGPVSVEVVVHQNGPFESASAQTANTAAFGGPEDPGFVQVAADLAALLWQDINESPS
jgi:hypothetical protein